MKSNLQPGPEDQVRNVHVFSNEIAQAIREAINVVHPAAIVGVLAYHQQAVASSTHGAFLPPVGPNLIHMPPAGFKP
jgi:hypothetical protein